MKNKKGERWSFNDFITRCVIGEYRRGIEKMEPHYRPQSIQASPCTINYNFIGKFGVRFIIYR